MTAAQRALLLGPPTDAEKKAEPKQRLFTLAELQALSDRHHPPQETDDDGSPNA